MRSLSIASTGMLAQQLNVETISNNIANMNTTAFKRQRAEFQDLLYQTTRRAGTASADNGAIVPSGIQIGLGVKTAAVYRITEQGNLLSHAAILARELSLPTVVGVPGATRLLKTGERVSLDGHTGEIKKLTDNS